MSAFTCRLAVRAAAIAYRMGMSDEAILAAAQEAATVYKPGKSPASAIDAGVKKAKQIRQTNARLSKFGNDQIRDADYLCSTCYGTGFVGDNDVSIESVCDDCHGTGLAS